MRYEKIFDKKVEHNSITYSLDSSVFLATSFTFFGTKSNRGYDTKKGEHMWTHEGIMQNIGLSWQPNFHANRKKSLV